MKKTLFAAALLFIAVAASAQTSWKPAGDLIKTKWAEKVDPKNPLPEYPRPQMVRQDWQNLNGLWDYAIIDDGKEYSAPQGKILVPFCPESSLSGVQKTFSKDSVIWYERTFSIPSKWKNKDVLLHFGAVDWKAEVWVNDHKVGEHTGGYVPFSFNITPYLRKHGKQTLKVRAYDASDNSFQPRGKQVLIPCGIWYTPVSGIWQTVWMEPVAKTHIENYLPEYNAKDKTLSICVNAEALAAGDVVSASLSQDGKQIASANVEDGQVEFKLQNPKLWTPDSPYLYDLSLKIQRNGKVIDEVKGYTVLRTITESRKKPADRNHVTYKRMALNGEEIFMFGPLDQGWWPDGLYTAPTDEALKSDLVKIKEWGWNTVRKHIKVEPARWYYWCDVLGIMVWQDMPSIGDFSPRKPVEYRDKDIMAGNSNIWGHDSFLSGTDAAVPQQWKNNYYKEWGEIIDFLKPFKSIVIWVPFNEGWGQFDTPEAVEFTRAKDSTRLINESSGGNYHFSGDIIDVHHYSCPAMNVFEHHRINVLGEYGGLGLPLQGHLWKQDKNWGYGKVLETGDQVLDLYRDFAQMLKTFISTGCSA
nr:beta-galactosidase [Bacteroidales bacterium]